MVLRYLLKKRFARGSYGEVWLAFHGNCQEAFSAVGENANVSCNSSFGDTNARNYSCSSNSSQGYALDDNLFIMKRVMVIVLDAVNFTFALRSIMVLLSIPHYSLRRDRWCVLYFNRIFSSSSQA